MARERNTSRISKKNSLLGRIAVEFKLVTPDQMEQCSRELGGERTDRNASGDLGELLVSKKLITPGQLQDISRERDRRLSALLDLKKIKKTDYLFGQLLVRYNKATQIQINKCLEIQEQRSRNKRHIPRLGELLVEHGFIDSHTIDEILKLQNKQVFLCPKCARQYNVIGVEEGKTYHCRTCRSAMVPKTSLDAVRVDETHFGVDLEEIDGAGDA